MAWACLSCVRALWPDARPHLSSQHKNTACTREPSWFLPAMLELQVNGSHVYRLNVCHMPQKSGKVAAGNKRAVKSPADARSCHCAFRFFNITTLDEYMNNQSTSGALLSNYSQSSLSLSVYVIRLFAPRPGCLASIFPLKPVPYSSTRCRLFRDPDCESIWTFGGKKTKTKQKLNLIKVLHHI